jgi:hypothetical protein
MMGSRKPRSIRDLWPRATRGGSVVLLAGLAWGSGPALAADADISDPAAVGNPIVLFQPSVAPAPVKPQRNAVTALPARPGAAAARAGVVTRQLIPPAPVPVNLGPPPAPRPALPIETGLQPLGPSPQAPQSGTPGLAAAKPPWG